MARSPNTASAANPAEITAFQPASDRPRMRIAAASQRTTLTVSNCFRKSVDRGGAVKRTGAFRWPRPKSPFDARVIGAKTRARQKHDGESCEDRPQKSSGAARGKEQREPRKRNGGVIENALLEAKLAGYVAKRLENKSARDRRAGDRQNRKRHEKLRFGAHRGGQMTRAAIQKPTTIAAARIPKNQPKYLSSKALTVSP